MHSRSILFVPLAAAALMGAPVLVARAQTGPAAFPDVPENHWAYQSMRELAERGLVKGYPDGKFLGSRALSRYEFATLVDRLLQTVREVVQAPGPPAPRTPGANVTQSDLNRIQVFVDTFSRELAAIQTDVTAAKADIAALREEISALRKGVDEAKTAAARAQTTADNSYGPGANRKFQIGGFVQFRYEQADGGSRATFPEGSGQGNGYNGNYLRGGNNSSFKIRDARLFTTGQLTPNARYLVEIATPGSINTGATGTAQVFARRVFGQYTFGNGSAKNPSLIFGQFQNPFGFSINNSRAERVVPERPLAFNETTGVGLFGGQEQDRGVQLRYAPLPFSGSISVINGTGNLSNDTNRFKDIIVRAAYLLRPGLSVGASYYDGQILTTTDPAANTQTSGDKKLYGLDAQFTSPAGPFVQVEYVGGKYEALAPISLGAPSGTTPTIPSRYLPGNDIEGYYLIGGYTFSPRGSHPFSLAAFYDKFRRAKDISTQTDENAGFGALYNLDRTTRVRVFYIDPSKVAHAPADPAPDKIGLFIGELQVRF